MAQNAILFIPDISGFTEFVHHTDISHSRHIISELLELLIDSNTINLELAEVEGDALFLYKLQDEIKISQIEAQIQKMYVAFHIHLKRYEYQRICHCGACSSAYNLHLKFVVHYGEIEFIKVKESKKPYGSAVIQVHRLLKNDIQIMEYALFTESLKPILNEKDNAFDSIDYDFGTISFSYRSLSYLKEQLPQINPIPNDVPKHKLLSRHLEIKAPILDLYEIISNFEYRQLWSKGIDKLDYKKDKVNRVGEKHKCLVNRTEVEQTTISKKAKKGQLVYGESTRDLPFTKRMNVYFILEEKTSDLVHLDIEIYADFKRLGFLMKPLLKKTFQKVISENIKALILLAESNFIINQSTK